MINCDASSTGIGAHLSQIREGESYTISYASQKLTKTQKAWPMMRERCMQLFGV